MKSRVRESPYMARREPHAYLRDALRASKAIREFTAGKALADYQESLLLRSAVERLFTIIGESLIQLRQFRPDLVARIGDHAQIIAFRNVLVHGYAAVDETVVWSIIDEKLPGFVLEVEELLVDIGTIGSAAGLPPDHK